MSRTDRARSIRIGKNLWFNHRGIYEKRRRFGEEELKKKKTLKEEIFEGNDFMERQQEYEWVLGLHEIIGKENKSIIKRQLTEAWKASMDAGKQHIKELAKEIPMPENLKPNERKVFKSVINSGFIGRNGVLKHHNGIPISKKWIGKLSGIENVKSLERAIRGLIEKNVLKKIQKNRYRIAFQAW